MPSPAVVAAGEDDAVILRAGSPDGAMDLLLHRSEQGPTYSLEVVLRQPRQLPQVVLVRYGTSQGSVRLLLVPITTAVLGPPNAEVRLDGFDPAEPWEARTPASPGEVEDWSGEVVDASVDAAATPATLDAWRDVRPFVPETAQFQIGRRLP